MMELRKWLACVLAAPVVVCGVWVGGLGSQAETDPHKPAASSSDTAVYAPMINDHYVTQVVLVSRSAPYDRVSQRFVDREGEFAHLPPMLTAGEAVAALALWRKACEADPTPFNRKARKLLAGDQKAYRAMLRFARDRKAAAHEATRLAAEEGDTAAESDAAGKDANAPFMR